MNKDARFYFANLCADIARCAAAFNTDRYDDSLRRARRTLALLRMTRNVSAYEEGLLLFRALKLLQTDELRKFSEQLNHLVALLVYQR